MLTGATTVTEAQYFVEDDMGNVQGTLKDSATVAQTVTYDDLGTPAVLGDTTNRLTWKGLSYDKDLMLTYMRARWYDPMIGRFVSEDPLGLAGGINPYVYANNDPVNGSDPSGMDQCVTINIPPAEVCSGNYCTELEGYTKEVCISGGSNGETSPSPSTWYGDRAPDQPASHAQGFSAGDAATIFRQVAKETAPFAHIMNCGGSAAALGVTAALDWSGATEIVDGVMGTEALVATISTISVESAEATTTIASVRMSTIHVVADATAVRSIDVGIAKSATLAGGYNVATGDRAPFWSYLPIGGSIYGIGKTYDACK